MSQSNGSISRSSITSQKEVQYTTEKSPVNLKSDINEINPDIDINNNSPLVIESGSKFVDDLESRKSKAISLDRSSSQVSNRRSKQIQKIFRGRNAVNQSQMVYNSSSNLKQESDSPYRSSKKNPRPESQTIDYNNSLNSDLNLQLT